MVEPGESDPVAVRTLATVAPHSSSLATLRLCELICGTGSDALLTAAAIALTEAMQPNRTLERLETHDCWLRAPVAAVGPSGVGAGLRAAAARTGRRSARDRAPARGDCAQGVRGAAGGGRAGARGAAVAAARAAAAGGAARPRAGRLPGSVHRHRQLSDAVGPLLNPHLGQSLGEAVAALVSRAVASRVAAHCSHLALFASHRVGAPSIVRLFLCLWICCSNKSTTSRCRSSSQRQPTRASAKLADNAGTRR